MTYDVQGLQKIAVEQPPSERLYDELPRSEVRVGLTSTRALSPPCMSSPCDPAYQTSYGEPPLSQRVLPVKSAGKNPARKVDKIRDPPRILARLRTQIKLVSARIHRLESNQLPIALQGDIKNNYQKITRELESFRKEKRDLEAQKKLTPVDFYNMVIKHSDKITNIIKILNKQLYVLENNAQLAGQSSLQEPDKIPLQPDVKAKRRSGA